MCHGSYPIQVTWNPELQQLVFSPLKEQEKLRGDVIGKLNNASTKAPQPLTANRSLSLGVPVHHGKQSELLVSFVRPTTAVNLTVSVLVGRGSGGGSGPAKGSSTDPTGGLDFIVEYVPPSQQQLALGSPSDVQVRCPAARVTDTLKLAPSDTHIDVRVFVDVVLAEAYFMGGRVAMTVDTDKRQGSDMTVGADSAGAAVASAETWSVQSIWVKPTDVLAMPRPDGGRGAENSALMAERIHAQQQLQH